MIWKLAPYYKETTQPKTKKKFHFDAFANSMLLSLQLKQKDNSVYDSTLTNLDSSSFH